MVLKESGIWKPEAGEGEEGKDLESRGRRIWNLGKRRIWNLGKSAQTPTQIPNLEWNAKRVALNSRVEG
jgi:hypothetical protein